MAAEVWGAITYLRGAGGRRGLVRRSGTHGGVYAGGMMCAALMPCIINTFLYILFGKVENKAVRACINPQDPNAVGDPPSHVLLLF